MDTPPLSFCLVHAKAADAPYRSSFPNAPVIGSVPPKRAASCKISAKYTDGAYCSPCLPPPAAAPPPEVDCPNAAWAHTATTTTVRICRAFISCSFDALGSTNPYRADADAGFPECCQNGLFSTFGTTAGTAAALDLSNWAGKKNRNASETLAHVCWSRTRTSSKPHICIYLFRFLRNPPRRQFRFDICESNRLQVGPPRPGCFRAGSLQMSLPQPPKSGPRQSGRSQCLGASGQNTRVRVAGRPLVLWSHTNQRLFGMLRSRAGANIFRRNRHVIGRGKKPLESGRRTHLD